MKLTGKRDAFGIHADRYYKSVYEIFSTKKSCEILLARYKHTPVAAMMVFFASKRAWYFYGASSNEERNRMPTYLLQWDAMRLAASRGCETYDLWGIPDFEEKFLEDNFMSRDDGLWGVYRFKRGFGGEIKRSAGVFQKVLNPGTYKAYQTVLRLRKATLAQ
jgi:lipid II:glycine glycyltransferase (peptidoglycan interpeptide bridge formation enzyme)